MDFSDIRRTMLTAVASDDLLVELLVLKGGNALQLIHKIGERASLELDFSMEGDFEDIDEIRERLFRALKDRFDSAGFVVFDETLRPHPPGSGPGSDWSGYIAEFKLISREKYLELNGNLEKMRFQSQPVGPRDRRKFKIEVSKFEYCKGKTEANVEEYTCYVYTTEMIAAEKLRAICQQMPEYPGRRYPVPRARDFYDIHAIVTYTMLDIVSPSFVDLLREIFKAKEVPLALLRSIEEHREFHRQGWPRVKEDVYGYSEEFDYYFDFVLEEVGKLEARGII